MTPTNLAPRHRNQTTSLPLRPQSARTHDESEWAAIHAELERLYVHGRRRLRYVMQYMEKEHGFRATEQMYKKRFAKWGFQKNSKQPMQMSRLKNESKIASSTGMSSIPALPTLDRNDGLKLMFLTNVQTWSLAFFELVQAGDLSVVDQLKQPQIDELGAVETKEMSFAFKLVMDLLDRGHGELAGRVARKAFLLVETMLTLQGPVIIWNLLETMHNMIVMRHEQLFRMLLAHLIGLSDGRIPETHPLCTMLRGLRTIVADPTSAASISTNSSLLPERLSSAASTGKARTLACVEHWLFPQELSSLLEQAWIFNAQILFDRLDPRFIQLYCRVFWDSCSIDLPPAVVNAAIQWHNQLKTRHEPRAVEKSDLTETISIDSHGEEPWTIQHALDPWREDLPLQHYDFLRRRGIETLRKHRKSILSEGTRFSGSTTVLLGLVAGLVSAEIHERWPLCLDNDNMSGNMSTRVPRTEVSRLACTLKTLLDLNVEACGGRLGASYIEQLHTLVTLREYAQGKTDPQVVREMWLLQDALTAAGKSEKADEIEQDVYRRLEEYVEDIPIHSI